jgi:hypothetical protein
LNVNEASRQILGYSEMRTGRNTTRNDVIHMFVDKVADQVVPLDILVRLPLLSQQTTAVVLDTTRGQRDVLCVFGCPAGRWATDEARAATQPPAC